jgi:hypothetical protein
MAPPQGHFLPLPAYSFHQLALKNVKPMIAVMAALFFVAEIPSQPRES